MTEQGSPHMIEERPRALPLDPGWGLRPETAFFRSFFCSGFEWSEIAVIAVVALICIGPKDMPVALRAITGVIKKMRRMAGEFQSHVDDMLKEADLHEVSDTIRDIRGLNMRLRHHPRHRSRWKRRPVLWPTRSTTGRCRPSPSASCRLARSSPPVLSAPPPDFLPPGARPPGPAPIVLGQPDFLPPKQAGAAAPLGDA